MKLGFIFPGQGSQYPGMGKDLYEGYDCVKKMYEIASKVCNKDIAKLTFSSSEEELGNTKNTQIAILVMSLAILQILKEEKIEADIMAGLSLGEYTALIHSEILELEEGIALVQKRGNLMQELVPEGNWKMAAIIGLSDEIVEEICKKVQEEGIGFIKPVNYNCPLQVVVSGDATAVEIAMEYAKEKGAKRAMELKTSGPFHTEKLEEASRKLREELEKSNIHKTNKIVIKNTDASPYQEEDSIKDILANHITHPVYFGKSIQKMIDLGVDTFIEIGPGKVLSGFVKRVSKEVNVFHIEDKESLTETIQAIINLK